MILGFDIGGTKCALIKAKADGENIKLLDKRKIPTRLDILPEEMIESLISLADEMLDGETAEKIGVSCGGPLNSVKPFPLSFSNQAIVPVPVVLISNETVNG